MVVNKGKILMLKRFNTGYEDGKWDFPAGHLEKGETLKQCAVRELKEETNLQVFERDLKCVCYVDDLLESEHIDIFFTVKDFLGEPIIMECMKCNGLMWMDIKDLKTDNKLLSRNVINFLETIKGDF